MAHCSVTSGKFVCPKDFADVINTEGLCLEDIDDDCELFIIQASADADLMKFHDQQLLLSGPTTLHCPGEDGQEEMYRCTMTNADRQVARACLVLPERNSVKLCAVQKHIEGVIHIEKRAAFPHIGCPEELYEKSKTPVNLKKKATPLSSGNSMVLSENYGKKGASNALTEDAPRTSDSSQSVRKKNHSKHRTQDTDPSADIAVKSKKKHKDKKQDHVFHIQAKALSDSGENSCSDEDVPITGTECKNEIRSSMDPESTGSQMSQNDITSYKNHFASVKKKKKRMSHGAEESESSEKMGVSLSHEYSPRKPLKKKHKTLYSSFTDLHSQESRENDKTKHKSDKLKELSSKKKHDNSNNTHVNNFEIEEEIEQDNVLEEISCQLSTSLEQKSKKKKKKKENYDDQSSYTYIPSTQIKQEIEDYEVERNDSYTDHLNEVSPKEISSSCEKKAKNKKKKKNFDDCSTSNSHISNLKIKEEIEEDMVEGKSYYTNDLNENGSEKKAKKKKKRENFHDCSTSNSHISNLKIKEEIEEDMVEGKSYYTNDLNENGSEKKAKKKKKRENFHDCSTSNSHFSNLKIKEEIEEDMVEGKSYYTNDLNENGSEKKAKKKKKKENFDDCSTSNSHISNLKIKEEIEDMVEGKSCYTSGLNENDYGEVSPDQKKKSKKKKKKDES